ncbi:hypothetical protein PISMIDRAFT_371338 [Pisolithus microcarpus 441]|uniref:Secreted protein n=1 Tax=Pisolithus microcarpus 441 TaxID=765257 RepID=A0A0C9YUE4_9AGAM|nr:hypothetical protein BKA83DRAFT_371338 [Pisolithus microcarpus]KIK13872.1 hypothetical protein PISMIDRAFT_371338 [Pisolithus microcarpus 441]
MPMFVSGSASLSALVGSLSVPAASLKLSPAASSSMGDVAGPPTARALTAVSTSRGRKCRSIRRVVVPFASFHRSKGWFSVEVEIAELGAA